MGPVRVRPDFLPGPDSLGSGPAGPDVRLRSGPADFQPDLSQIFNYLVRLSPATISAGPRPDSGSGCRTPAHP